LALFFTSASLFDEVILCFEVFLKNVSEKLDKKLKKK